MHIDNRVLFSFLTAAFITVILLYFRIPYATLQIIVLVLLAVMILFFKMFSHAKLLSHRYNLFVISSLFILLLVISTGGFTSHFLLIAFLYALAIGFLIHLREALIFLLLLFVVLSVQLYTDQQLFEYLVTDPGVIALFIITFLVAAALAYILSRYYHFKDVFVDLLQKQIKQKEVEEESILSGLDDLIIITTPSLEIISVNDAVERVVLLPKNEILHRKLFEVIFLKSNDDKFLSHESLPLNDVLQEKKPIQLHSYTLVTKTAASDEQYNLTAKPVLDLDGNVSQILFLLESGDSEERGVREEEVLDQVITRQQAVIEEVRRISVEKDLHDVVLKMDMIGKIDREIRYLLQLRSRTFQNLISPVNVAKLCKSTYQAMDDFAEALHVKMEYKLLNVSDEDASRVTLAESNLPPEELTRSMFTVQVNIKWFDILIHKLVDIAILLAHDTDKAQVVLSVENVNDVIYVRIFSSFQKLKQEDRDNLFKLNYSHLMSDTNLHLSSGLEGYIAKYISNKINTPIEIRIEDEGMLFELKVPAAIS